MYIIIIITRLKQIPAGYHQGDVHDNNNNNNNNIAKRLTVGIHVKSILSQTTQVVHNYRKYSWSCYTAELFAELGLCNRGQWSPALTVSG